MYRIGAFAALGGLTVETLRHWDALGVLRPAMVDRETGYRLYAIEQLPAVYRVLALKDAGLSLTEVAALERENLSPQAWTALLEAKAAGFHDEIARAQARLDRLYSSIFLVKNGGIALMESITIKQTQPILVCAQRRQIPRADFDTALDAMWPEVNSHIDAAGGQRVIPCLMLYHNGTWTHAQDTLDIEVAEPLAGPIRAGANVEVYELPAEERMACLVHKGPFSTMGKTYEALWTWMREQGYETRGPVREIYHKGDWLTDDPEEYLTEIQAPIA